MSGFKEGRWARWPTRWVGSRFFIFSSVWSSFDFSGILAWCLHETPLRAALRSLGYRHGDFPSADFFAALRLQSVHFDMYLFGFTTILNNDAHVVHSQLTSNLVSLWVEHKSLVPPFRGPSNMREIILRASHLKFLKLDLFKCSRRVAFRDYDFSRYQGSFTFKDEERFPPVEKLILSSYRWIHSTQEALKHWNWSNLTHLHLRKVSVHNFLQSVPPEELSQLQSFDTDGKCKENQRAKTTELMCTLIQCIRKLQVLVLQCSLSFFDISVIAKHGKTLNKLHLLDYETCGFFPTSQDTTLSDQSVKFLQLECPFLEDLMLVYDPSDENVSGTRRFPGPCALSWK